MDSIWWVLAMGAFFAGFIDAVAGGGGLIQLPMLLNVFPEQAPATLFGTNKSASIWGTMTAAGRYLRRVHLAWSVLGPALLCALLGGWCGARAVSVVPSAVLRPVILGLLITVAIYTFRRDKFGLVHAPAHGVRTESALGAAIGFALGFYDGFFGPGTGAFLVFLCVRVLGYDFLHASAMSKVLNTATNFAALGFFIPNGHVLWKVAGVMSVANVGGALLGSRLALKHGSQFVRWIFLAVVTALIAKLTHLTFFGA